MKRRLLSFVLAFAMLLSVTPVAVFAVERTGEIKTNVTWEDGDVITGVTIGGNVTITVKGTVTVAGTIRLAPDAICNVTFNGENNAKLIRGAGFTGQMFYAEGVSGDFQQLTFNNITLDGGAVWTGEVDKILKRGTTNSGVKATGSVLYLVCANAVLNNSVLQNHDDSTGEKANAVFLRYYSTIDFNNSEVRYNNSISTYYRGGVITVRQGGTVKTNNAEVYGNSGASGGFFGISSTGSYGGIAEVYNSKFYNNYADNGAVFLMQCNSKIGYLSIDGCEFYNNASKTAVLTEWAYSRPFIIKDSYFHDNECAVWDCHADPVLDLSGKIVIEEDPDYTKYLFETPLVISGPLAEGSKIPMSEASVAKLGGTILQGANGYTVTEADLEKFDLPEGYDCYIVGVNGDGSVDVLAHKPAAGDTDITLMLKDSLNAGTSEERTVYTGIECLPVCPFAHEGYVFAGWVDEEGNEVDTQKFTAAATLTATWKLETPVVAVNRINDVAMQATVLNTYADFNYTYQWYKNDVILDGETRETYTMTDVNTATYKCEVTVSDDGKHDPQKGSASGNASAPAYIKIGDAGFNTLAEAMAAVGAGNVVIELTDDATLSYPARAKFGAADTTSITIKGNGHTLTLNQKDSDWSSIGLTNANAKLVLNDMTIEKTGYGDTSGTWNTHAIIFTCNVEMNDVTVNNAIVVEDGATLNKVTIKEDNGYYGLWISGNGQTVTMNGGSITATNGGRGIKIDEEYVANPAKVNLTVTNAKFTTAQKAAILVKTAGGADITYSNVDISEVDADHINVVWVDEDAKEYFTKVTVNGGRAFIEPGVEGISYVSLGDSMTNGYGLPGYEYEYPKGGDENDECAEGCTKNHEHTVFHWANGYLQETPASYPVLFAKENNFILTQMAMSAMRVEDLHWVLEADPDNLPAFVTGEWDDAWYTTYGAGDYYTWDEFTTGRFEEVYPGSTTANVIKEYQEAVKEADVISLGIGNANFGVFMLGRLTDAIGFDGKPEDTEIYTNLDNALRECAPNVKSEIEVLLSVTDAKLSELLVSKGIDANSEMFSAIIDTFKYAVLSYALNYAGTLEAILTLNPDAEIILVGIMNTMAGMQLDLGNGQILEMADVLGILVNPVNAYIAALPTYMQATGNATYANATFYYAEAPEVECMVENYKTEIETGNDIVRDRFVTEIVGTAGNPGMVWEKVVSAFSGYGINLQYITLEDVKAYEEALKANNPVTDVLTQDQIASCAVYLAFENAIVESSANTTVSLNSILALATGLDSIFKGVAGRLQGVNLYNPVDITNVLTAALISDPTLTGLFHLFARMMIGNGLGAHPSATGHNQLAAAVINAYENGFTAEDQTKENLKVVIPAAYAQAYQYALANGYIDMAKGYIGIASGALGTANTYVSTLEVPAQLLNTKALLLEEIGKTQVTLAKIDALLNINQLTPETWAQILAMEEEIYAHMATLEDLAAELGVVGNIAMDQIGVVANYYAGMIDAIANNAYAWVANGVQEFNAEYAAWVESVGLMADKIDPELGAAVRAYLTETPAEALAIMYAAGDDAVVEFIATTAAASDDIKVIITAISAILNSDIADIAAAVKNSAEVAAILAQIDQVKAEIEATVAEMKNYPVSSALAYQQIIDQLKGQLAILQGQLVDAILNSVDDVDPTLRPLLNKALNALKDAVRVAANYGAEYGAWFDARFDEMLGDLLALLIDNTNEFGSIAGPILGEAIDNFLHYVGDLAYEKGTELLDKVENEIIPEFIDTLKGYGAQAWAQLVAKLDALGLLDAVDQAQKDLNDLYELINSYITDDLADAYDTLLDRMTELKDNIADLIETVGNELANTSEEEIRATLAALQEKLENLYNAILALESVVNEAIHGSINTAIAMAQGALNNVAAAVADLAGVLSEDAAAAVADLANDVKVMLNEAYVDAITDTYTVTPDSYYVAMGDSSVFGENTYAQKLAAELGLTTSQFINLSAAGMSVAETIGLVNANVSEIAKADLITIGYSNNTMMEFVIAQLKAATDNGEAQPMDWSALVGEKLVPHVQKALADITADMLASGVDAQYAELLSVAVEAYAYAAVSHALNYPTVVGSIHEINPDALVVIVGMYNSLAGVSVKLSSTETIEIGDYVQKLIDLANMETLAYAMLAPNTIYVDAPNVTTQAQPGEIPVVNFLMGLLMNGTDKYYATEDGHAYIAQQILNALTVTKTGLLGDVNNDGKVSLVDAVLVLDYCIHAIEADRINVAVADVSGDGKVSLADAVMILDYSIKAIDRFPAEISNS